MKKAIAHCLVRMVRTKYGQESWVQNLSAGMLAEIEKRDENQIENTEIGNLFTQFIAHSGCDTISFFKTFGAYWNEEFAPKYFRSWFIMSLSIKDFGRQMDKFYAILSPSHQHTKHFSYHWLDNNTLTISYQMPQEYIILFETLVQGLIHFHMAQVRIEKNNDNSTTMFF